MDVRAVVVIGVFGFAAVVLGGFVAKLVFRCVDGRDAAAREGAGQVDDAERPESIERAALVLRGGAWIGGLERLAIFAGIVSSWPEAIPIALAVKGLGRYPELRSGETSAVAERFIIGTFVSVLWACGCAGLAMWLRR